MPRGPLPGPHLMDLKRASCCWATLSGFPQTSGLQGGNGGQERQGLWAGRMEGGHGVTWLTQGHYPLGSHLLLQGRLSQSCCGYNSSPLVWKHHQMRRVPQGLWFGSAHARGAGLALGAQAVGPAERQRGQAMLGLAGQVRSWVCPGPLGNLLGGG